MFYVDIQEDDRDVPKLVLEKTSNGMGQCKCHSKIPDLHLLYYININPI